MKTYEFSTALTKKEVIITLKSLINQEYDKYRFYGEVFEDEFTFIKHRPFHNDFSKPYIKGKIIEEKSGTKIKFSAKLNKWDKIGTVVMCGLWWVVFLCLAIYDIIQKTSSFTQFIGLFFTALTAHFVWLGIVYIFFSISAKRAVSKFTKILEKELDSSLHR